MQPLTTLLTLTLLATPLLAIPLVTPSIPADNVLTPIKRGACSSDIQKLVDGINSDIVVQKQAASQATILASILSAQSIDVDDFNSARSKMVDIVNKAISIRKNNVKIAPSGCRANDGLSVLASAQSDELRMVKALTADRCGGANVQTLRSLLATDIKQNQQNARDAAYGCTAKRDLVSRDDDDDYDDYNNGNSASNNGNSCNSGGGCSCYR